MNQYHADLIKLLRKLRVQRVTGVLLGSMGDAFVFFSGCIMVCAWIDVWIPILFNIRMVLRYLIAGVSIFIVVRRGMLPFVRFGLEKISLLVQKELDLKDALINSLQFGFQQDQSGISSQLKQAYIEKAVTEVSSRHIPAVWVKNSLINPMLRAAVMLGIAVVMLLVPPRPLARFFPRVYGSLTADEIYRFLDVHPKNSRVPEGKQVTIRVETKQPLPAACTLKVRGSQTEWETAEMLNIDDINWIFQIDHLTSKVQYYVSMRDLKTEVYSLTPIAIPKIIDMKMIYNFPSYTGKIDAEIFNESSIRALRGTKVTIDARVNIPVVHARVYFNDGRQIPAEASATNIQAQFVLDKDGECWFELTGTEDNLKTESAHLPIQLEDDRDPEITILAPAEDLLTSPDQMIPITYTTEDDFGLTQVRLVFSEMERDEKQSRPIKNFVKQTAVYTGDYTWQIAGLMLKSGEIIEYYLEAYDNDMLSGPHTGTSERYRIEMTSYKREHERITDQLEDFRQDLIDVLGDQILAHESLQRVLEKSESKEVTPENNELVREVRNMQQSIHDRLKDSAAKLKNILPSMERDPLGDVSAYMEHAAMQKNLESLAEHEMHNIISSLNAGNPPRASETQESVISELEKMSLLSEDVLKKRTMQDLVNTADSMLNKSEGLIDNLEQISETPAPEDIAKLNEALQELSSMMEEISAQLKDMPQELPDDFINQEAIQSLNVQEMNALSKGIAEALQAGDFKTALQMAKALAEQALSMLQTLRDGASQVMEGMGESNALTADIEKSIQELEQIIVEEKSLLEFSHQHEQIRQERIFKEQEELLKKLIDMQDKLITKTADLDKKISSQEPTPQPVWSRNRIQFYNLQENMKKVLAEFKTGRVFKSQEYLLIIISDFELISVNTNSQLDQAAKNKQKGTEAKEKKKELERAIQFYTEISSEVQEIHEGEKDILQALKKSPETNETVFKSAEQKNIKDLSQTQEKLRGRTRIMTERLQEFSRQTALMGPEVFSPFQDASTDMHDASEDLTSFDTKQAVEHEESALDNLMHGKQALAESLQSLQQMLSGAGKPMAGFMQMPGGTGNNMPGGVMGAFNGQVHIPASEEYTPPQEFREEIMKSLKENYPPIYEPVIKEYFKKLSK
ncbi:MAG: DUF4175 family protein [bacterium]